MFFYLLYLSFFGVCSIFYRKSTNNLHSFCQDHHFCNCSSIIEHAASWTARILYHFIPPFWKLKVLSHCTISLINLLL
jgi:hypothetical protein